MTEKEMIEIKHGSENMVDLLNQEQTELKKDMIEEMAKCYCDYCMAQTGEKKCENQADKRCRVFWDCEFFYNAGYRKIPEGAVVLTREEYYRLKSLESRVAELENGIAKSMLGCEFMPECCIEERKRTASVVNEIKAFVYNNDGLIEKINNIAKRYGVEVEE